MTGGTIGDGSGGSGAADGIGMLSTGASGTGLSMGMIGLTGVGLPIDSTSANGGQGGHSSGHGRQHVLW